MLSHSSLVDARNHPRMRRLSRTMGAAGLLLVAAATSGQLTANAQTYPGRIGVNLSTRRGMFVDLGKTLRRFTTTDGSANATIDSNGWPTQDAESVVFDTRAVPAWAPPIDDPAAYQPNLGGTYKVSFNGQATIANGDPNSPATFANQIYTSGTNLTTLDLIFPTNGTALLVLKFTNTVRTFGGATNTGITNVKIIRPGYPSNTTQVFTNEIVNGLAPFSVIRTMDWTGTNFNPGYYGDAGHHIFQWADRTLPTDSNVEGLGTAFRPAAVGVAWEYVILLANALNKDVWINTPISASGTSTTDTTSYIYKLAQLFKNGDTVGGVVYPGLNAGLHVYVEHSNEVWNFGFGQYTWNKLEAVDAVAGGGLGTTHINSDGSTDQEVWAHRRHGEREMQIANIFATVFGAGSMNNTVRPIYASWSINSQSHFIDVFTWMNSFYGAVNGYFYALSGAFYYGETPTAGESVATILANMTTAANSNVTYIQQLHTDATNYGLHYYAYEGGPDNGGGSTTNVGNRILANRDPGMGTLLQNDLRTHVMNNGVDMYVHYNFAGSYSRYGCWGLTDDEANLATTKMQGILNVIGTGTPPPAPANLTATAGNAQVVLNWTASSGATSYNVYRGTTAGGESTTAIATGIATTAYTNTGLTNGTTYYYKVKAVNASGTSGYSNEASAKPQVAIPPVPTGLAATPGNAQVALTWNASTGATAYDVKRSTVSGSGYVTVSSPTVTNYTNTGLTNGTTYYFVVDAKNSSGTSANSSQVSAQPSAGGAGSLTGSSTAWPASPNLTTEGTSDWAHWGYLTATTFDHKSSGGSQISNATVLGGTASQWNGISETYTWSDGTPDANASTQKGIAVPSGTGGSGFSFTVPTGTTSHTLHVYVANYNSTCTFTAHLSDGSAADYTANITEGVGQLVTEFTLTFKAASAGKTLNVTWATTVSGGTVYLEAATLI